MKKDSFGKEWYFSDEFSQDPLSDPLREFIIKNKLHLTIEYKTEDGQVKFICVATTKKDIIFYYKNLYPLNDSEILSRLKEITRGEKIDNLLNGK